MNVQHAVGYNSQRNNFNFAGKFSGYKQCFSTSAWMFLSFFSSLVKAGDDEGLAWYLDQVEAGVGKTGIAERTIAKMPYIPRIGSSFWWVVQIEAIRYVIAEHRKRSAVVREGNPVFIDKGPWEALHAMLENGPAIVATHKMGDLPGGHIVLITGVGDEQYIINDPFGNPLKKYVTGNGYGVVVPGAWFREQCERAVGSGKVRFIGWGA